MKRRDILIGSACFAAAASAYALEPRRHVSLMRAGQRIDTIIPRQFGEWTSQDVSDLVAPAIEGSLASKLYNETVGRVYTNAGSGAQVMLLAAHGDTQSDDLQLHRPEICYPAFGFSISDSQINYVDVFAHVSIPSRQLVADAPDRRESIIYWSRLGESLPLDRKEQQLDRMAAALRGDIVDGLLVRLSILGTDAKAAFRTIEGFIPRLVMAVATPDRAILIGSARAADLAAAGV
jgi:EpsI family protein